jgi:hypothetical protein
MARIILLIVLVTIPLSQIKAYNQERVFEYALDSYWFIQVLELLKIDIYDCTQVGLSDSRYEENNSLARWFTSRGYYNGLYICSALLNMGAYFIASWWYWNKSIPELHAKVFRKLYLIIITIAELYAISTWDNVNARAELKLHFTF